MYLALYRKYRPTVFGEVAGQEPITSTLRREVAEGRVAHAYLFTGTHGTGKTTCARILAKAVNCLHPVNGDPCNECEICKGITDGSIMDVIEIDAASNTGVENIRDIRDETMFTPAKARRRVYIIDEVHMLSAGAFNALLKTLEDTPEHVMFILATTEVHKVAPTVLSRCQRFHFQRIEPETMVNLLEKISEKEQISADRGALQVIAQMAEGSLRDALSMLDQCSASGQALDAVTVRQWLGCTAQEDLLELVSQCIKGDATGALTTFDQMYRQGANCALLTADLAMLMRDLMVVSTVQNPTALLSNPAAPLQPLRELAARLTLERKIANIRLLQDTMQVLPRSCNPRVDFELCLFGLCNPALCCDAESLNARIAQLEQRLDQAVPAASKPKEEGTNSPSLEPAVRVQPPVRPERMQAEPSLSFVKVMDRTTEKAPKVPPPRQQSGLFAQWGELQDRLRLSMDLSYRSLLGDAQAFWDGSVLTLVTKNPFALARLSSPKARESIRDGVRSILGQDVKVVVCSADEYQKREQPATAQQLNTDAFEALLNEKEVQIKD